MANFNPHAPRIIGQEWVPIRDENLTYDTSANTFERGTGFTLATTRQLNNVRGYIHKWPDGEIDQRVFTANIYRRGEENASGPIRSVLIPCNAGSITGSSALLTNAATLATAVFSPSDESYVDWSLGFNVSNQASFFFATNSYSNLLTGKRILGVNLVTATRIVNITALMPSLTLWLTNDQFFLNSSGAQASSPRFPSLALNTTPNNTVGSGTGAPVLFTRTSLGDTSRYFGVTGANSPDGTNDISQWSYPELQRFEASASNRLHIHLLSGVGDPLSGGEVFLDYMALEVFYCEENRVAWGSRIFGTSNIASVTGDSMPWGAIPIIVRNSSAATNPVLVAGDYTATLNESTTGDTLVSLRTTGRTPTFNETRQLYRVPTVPGVQVNIPYPLGDTTLGSTLTSTSTELIPQVTLHASGGTLTESMPYGRQAPGQVWGANTGSAFVKQVVQDSLAGGLNSFPWLRFWARRFGSGTSPLEVSVDGQNNSVFSDSFTRSVSSGWGTSTSGTAWANTGTGADSQHSVSGTQGIHTLNANEQIVGNSLPTITSPNVEIFVGHVQLSATPASGSPETDITLRSSGGNVLTCGVLWASAGTAQVFLSEVFGGVTSFSTFVAITGVTTSQAVSIRVRANGSTFQGSAWLEAGAEPAFPMVSLTVSDLSSGTIDVHSYASTGPVLPFTTSWDNMTITQFDSRASISVTDFDALSEVLEGWKQIDFRLSPAPSFGAGTAPTVTWTTSPTVLPGNRWEILGAAAPALTGTAPGNLSYLTPVSSPNQLTVATYGAPISGAQVAMTWLPELGPYVTTPTLDPTADVSFLFAVDAPAVTGFVGVTAAQALTGIGQNCGLNPAYIPSSLTYTQLTWVATASAYPTTGFGYYELQRQDSLTSWQTIAQLTSPAATGFKDFEARISLQSDYRIRGVDYYGFYGPWSSTVSVTIAAPGMVGTAVTADSHVLAFTSNSAQSGSLNLAYCLAWDDGIISEDFAFPEATFVQLQAMYDRDFFTAFHPTERGGEQFGRNILVQAAAIPPETLADFKSLRDMAWANTPYTCVRDEDGNRWFANVAVPAGTVQRSRQLYRAQIQVTETTDTAAQVRI